MLPIVVVSDRARQRLKHKHPWVFSNEIETKPDVAAGEQVEIRDRSDRGIAIGYYNPHTLITVRVLSFKGSFHLQEAVLAAVQRREQHFSDHVYRAVFGESDGLPGLIVDRYEQTIVAQMLTAGMERMRDQVVKALVDVFKPQRVILRNDSPYRELEGLPLNVEFAYGDSKDEEFIHIDGIGFYINFRSGQKTGMFLDQRANRRRLIAYGSAESMLDVFSYTGAWALYGAKAGIRNITAVDASQDALHLAQRNAEANGSSINTVADDAIPFLRNSYSEERRYDRIVLDPPAFCKSKRQLAGALRGYREINLRALKLLSRDGILFTCSCSQPVTPDIFLDMLASAAADSGRTVQLKELLLQPPDHPILLSFPESAYLKCAVLQVV